MLRGVTTSEASVRSTSACASALASGGGASAACAPTVACVLSFSRSPASPAHSQVLLLRHWVACDLDMHVLLRLFLLINNLRLAMALLSVNLCNVT